MAWEDIIWESTLDPNCTAKLTLKSSNGWSGDVVRYGYNVDISQRQFYFKMDGTITGTPWGTLRTYTDGACRTGVLDVADAIVGISLEHMGKYLNTTYNYDVVQFKGKDFNADYPSWGAQENDTALRLMSDCFSCDLMTVVDEHGTETDYNDVNYNNVTWLTGEFLNYIECQINGYHFDVEIDTDLPIFETDADLLEYCQSGGTITNKILNTAQQDDPEEEYKEQFDFWFVKNKWGYNTRNVDSNSNTAKNYRFYPKRKGICFIKHTPTSAEPYDRILYNYSNYEPYFAAWGETADEDFGPNPGTLTTHFLTKSISFGPSDYYTKFDFDTNIPLWNTQQDADDYFNGLKDISDADNYAYISRQDNEILNPDLPGTDIDESTTLGTNGMRYSYGNRLYEITNVELSSLMTELFTPANFQDIIDGNKLFGSNTMEAVSGVIYIPLTSLDAVCDLGSLANVKIGSWESQQAQGRRIIKNEGTIDCGTFFYNRTYNDYRDYEPYNLLFANLPFCGCHQLTISKYIDKTVGVSYNIDITTGAIVCKLTADGLLVDIFDGTCGASRPISATDNNAYINNVVGAITGASSQASGAIEGITNTVDVVGKATSAGAVAAGGAALGGALFAGGVAASGVYTAYQIKNAVDNPPQMHRGSLVGNLAYSLNTKPTFLFYSKRTIRPENELAVVGYPSGHGGTIGTFNGFLSCGAVKLANFNGTKAEESELFEILKGGIYI